MNLKNDCDFPPDAQAGYTYLVNVFFHAQPIFVTDFDATVSPFIVVGTFCWIE